MMKTQNDEHDLSTVPLRVRYPGNAPPGSMSMTFVILPGRRISKRFPWLGSSGSAAFCHDGRDVTDEFQ